MSGDHSHSDRHDGVHRRDVLVRTANLLSLGVAAAALAVGTANAAAPVQDDWAQCVNCSALFFNGDRRNKGHCPAAGVPSTLAHVGERGDFKKYQVTHDDSGGPGQSDWRFCRKCSALFFDGFADKGVCAADKRGHEAAGLNFALYHNRRPGIDEEAGWRFCTGCHVLFNIGSNSKAGCAATGKAHRADPTSFQFVVGKKAARL